MSQNDGAWREGGRDIMAMFYQNGLGKVESFRLIRSPETTLRQISEGRGKGKRRKPWEVRKYG